MRKILAALIIILLLPSILLANEETDYNQYGALDIDVKISSKLNIDITEPSAYRIESISANISFVPREGNEQLIVLLTPTSTPAAVVKQNDHSVIYTWENPKELKFSYLIDSKIKTRNTFQKVQSKLNFPIKEVPVEYLSYVEPTEFIDFNKEIKDKASNILEGETDLYSAVFKIAEWVRTNVKYDLSTLTAKAVQKSTWVYENKIGVCDEITNLFISMMRSVGVPARFVAGQAFTNLNKKFGNHGWAEVYFPGEGWIPVDVTFGEYGWINPTHIKLQESTDSGTPSVNYMWESYGIDVSFDELAVRSNITQTRGEVEKYVEMQLETLQDKVGFGSFVPLKAKLKNPNPFYVPITVHLTKAPGIEGENLKIVLLKPLQEKNIFFILKLPDFAEEGLIYLSTVEAETNSGVLASTEFQYSKGYAKTDKQWAEQTVNSYTEREEKEYSPELSLKCILDKENYYNEEIAKLECEIENKGNINLEGVNICAEAAQCKKINLNIAEKRKEEWNIYLQGYKTKDLVVSAESKNIAAYSYPKLKIIEIPRLSIGEFGPSEVSYGEKRNLTITLKTNYPARNVNVLIKNLGKISLSSVAKEYTMEVPFNSKEFYQGNLEMKITFEDDAGKAYEINYDGKISIKNLPWYLRFWVWLDSLL